MKRIKALLGSFGEALLWFGFLSGAAYSLAPDAPPNAPFIAGLLALVAIGVRATRPEPVPAAEVSNGDQ